MRKPAFCIFCGLCILTLFFSSPEPKAHGELIVYQSSRRPSMRPSVSASAETDVYLCVLNHGHLTLISMRFIP